LAVVITFNKLAVRDGIDKARSVLMEIDDYPRISSSHPEAQRLLNMAMTIGEAAGPGIAE
jgi:hypothetical protein